MRIKDVSVLIDGVSFFDLPVKTEEVYQETIEMSNNNDYKTGNLLDFAYFKKKNYRLIPTYLSKQTKLKDPQQISFIGKFLNIGGATMFFFIENSKKLPLIFLKILSQSYK